MLGLVASAQDGDGETDQHHKRCAEVQLPAIKHVDLRVEGNAAYRKYVGVFSTRRFRGGPVRREFY